MVLAAQRPTVRITADGAPFEVKDQLRARAYRWDQEARRWSKELSASAVESCLLWAT